MGILFSDQSPICQDNGGILRLQSAPVVWGAGRALALPWGSDISVGAGLMADPRYPPQGLTWHML